MNQTQLRTRLGKSRIFTPMLILGFYVSLLISEPSIADGPRHVYLTWQGDTSRTITVTMQSLTKEPELTVFYDEIPRHGKIKRYRKKISVPAQEVSFLQPRRWVYFAELTELRPQTRYYFVTGNTKIGFSKESQFKTLPQGNSAQRFIVGGDMGVGNDVPDLLTQAANVSPGFAVIGGDIAYDNGDPKRVNNWDIWLDRWQEYMKTPSGDMIPMILAIGNHETQQGGPSGRDAPFLESFFRQTGERTYFAKKIGDNIVLLILDTNHNQDMSGQQTEWLEKTLVQYKDIKNKFAIYHVPIYPSGENFDPQGIGGKEWIPLFDKYGLVAAFENHDHLFKRTFRLRQNQIVKEGGVVYLGDGYFGGTAERNAKDHFFLAKAARILHFWQVDVSAQGFAFKAINSSGRVFDVFPETAQGAAQAKDVFLEITRSNRAGVVINRER